MKKVLFVATVTKHINAFHIPYLKWFKEQGYEVHVASNGNEPIEYCDKHYNLPFERFPLKMNNVKTYNQLKNIINDNEYEIVHCHTPVGGVLTRLAARNARKKGTRVIYTAHGFHFYKGASTINWIIYYPIEKYLAKYTDCLITINKEDYELAKRRLKNINMIKLVYGVGVDSKKFDISKYQKSLLESQFELTEKDIILTYVAELNNNKNQQLLINTIQELIKQYPDYKLILVGDGVNKDKYKGKIKKKGLEKNVYLLGKRDDVPKILSITDIYVASSIREGLGLNIIEAMYMNLPIIATDNRGHRELINEKYLVKNNKIELFEKILELEDISNYEYKVNKQLYSVDNVLIEMSNIYSNIIEGKE